MQRYKDWLVPVAVIVITLGAFLLVNRGPRPGTTTGTAMGQDGPAAIPFTATTTDGKTISLSDYKGKVLLIDFWASWCPPCREEAPNVVRVYKQYHDRGFDVLGISLDQDRSAMTSFEKEVGMTWPQVFDQDSGNAMAGKYKVRAIPTMLLVDGTTGRIVAENPRGPELEIAVRAALARKG